MLPSQIATIIVILVTFLVIAVNKIYRFTKRHYGETRTTQVYPKPEYKGKHEKS